MTELLYREEVYAIIGAAIEVHKVLGSGFLEAVYQESLELELASRSIPFQAQQELRIRYKQQYLSKTYIADFIAFDKIIVEIKALDQLSPREQAQLLNYLKATGFALINFGSIGKLEWKRMALTSK
ncbi:MAG TPA: GxxExxY protein [Roseiflexaceae bacterium]|nr:GxxExxY protein [Roseiflexaceae bacterium]